MFIDRTMVSNMVRAVQRGWEDTAGAALWLTSYLFLLRVPSEALPACKGTPGNPDLAEKQTLIWREGDEVCLRLRRRKNRPQGSGVMRRGCTCNGGSTHMCAIHGLWDTFFEDLPDGHQPWQRIGPSQARKSATYCSAFRYWTHRSMAPRIFDEDMLKTCEKRVARLPRS